MSTGLRLLDSSASDDDYVWPDVYFTPGYGRAEESRGLGTWHSLTSPDGRWMLPFVRRKIDESKWDAVSPYGYAGLYVAPDMAREDAQSLGQHALNQLRSAGCVSLFLRRSTLVPQACLPVEKVPVVVGHPTRLLSLGSPDHMWEAMEGRARTAIRKAESSNLAAHVRVATHSDLSPASNFRTLYEGTMRRVGAHSDYLFQDEYYLNLGGALGDQLLVVEVLDGDLQVVASALLMAHGETLHYHLSGSQPEAARLGSNNLLIWAAMRAGHARGLTRFFLGGGISGRDSLYKFKKSFGGVETAFDGDGYVVNDVVYGQLVRQAQKVGALPTRNQEKRSFFPAYRMA